MILQIHNIAFVEIKSYLCENFKENFAESEVIKGILLS